MSPLHRTSVRGTYRAGRSGVRIRRRQAVWEAYAADGPASFWLDRVGLHGRCFETLQDLRRAVVAATATRPLPAVSPVKLTRVDAGRYRSGPWEIHRNGRLWFATRSETINGHEVVHDLVGSTLPIIEQLIASIDEKLR